MRRTAAVASVLFALGGVVAVHHSGPMPAGGHDDMGMTVVTEVCLAIITAVGVVFVALGGARRERPRPGGLMPPPRWFQPPPRLPVVRPRAGPEFLCVFRR